MQNKNFNQIRLQEWAGRFAEQKASGLTVRQWCEVNHFSFHTYNYWKHLFKEEVVDQVLPDIVPIPVSAVPEYLSSLEATEVSSIRSNCAIRANQSFMKLNINGISIEIDDSVSVEFLSKLLKRCAMLKDADPSYFAGIYIVCGYTDLRYGIDSLAASSNVDII